MAWDLLIPTFVTRTTAPGIDDGVSEQQLRQLVLDHQAILENAWVGICFTRKRRFQRLNRRFAELLGYAPEELIGQAAPMIYPDEAHYLEAGRVAGPVLAAGKSFQAEMQLRRRDGSVFWCKVTAKAVDPLDRSRGTIWIVDDITAGRAASDRLTKALIEQRAIMNNASVGILFTRDWRIVRYNPRIAQMFAIAGDAAIGRPIRDLHRSDAAYAQMVEAAQPHLSSGEPFETEAELARHDGRTFWARINGYLLNPEAASEGTIWVIEDISKRRRAEDELLSTTMLQRAILESAGHMIISTTRDGIVQMFNPAAERSLGYAAVEVIDTLSLGSLLAPRELLERAGELARELGRPVSGGEALFLRARDGVADEREWTFVRRDGSRFPVALSVTALRGAEEQITGFLAVGSDVTDRRKAEDLLLRARNELEQRVDMRTRELLAANEQLQNEIRERRQIEERMRHIAHHDALTGLPNRFQLQERLGHALTRAEEQRRQVVVMFIDLDRFKNINDSLGHAVGDHLLRDVGHRLRGCIRDGDFVARIGGDEFVVVLNEVKSARAAQAIAEKLLRSFDEPFRIDPHELAVTASIGLCVFPEDGQTVEALMRNADTAMYRAKSHGRNNFQPFESAMNAAAAQHFQLETSLRRALERQELELHFQPVFDAVEHRVIGAEALLRWNHPERGQLLPSQFVEVAEESGLIVPIGEWVLAEACRQAAAWRRQGIATIPVAVNLSGRQFWQRDLVRVVRMALADAGLPAEALELEITESTVMHQVDHALSMLDELNALGVTLAIDDFGTGYSCLSHLKRFPVDKLKVDRTFVRDIDKDPDDAAIVSAIIALSRTMHLTTVAEGVESASQRDLLIERGCVAMQGFLFCRPLPAAAFAEYLRAWPLPESTASGKVTLLRASGD